MLTNMSSRLAAGLKQAACRFVTTGDYLGFTTFRHRSSALDFFQKVGDTLNSFQYASHKRGDANRTEWKRNGQKNQTLLRGACHQYRYAEDGGDFADQPYQNSQKEIMPI